VRLSEYANAIIPSAFLAAFISSHILCTYYHCKMTETATCFEMYDKSCV